jgi:hypothetical protein
VHSLATKGVVGAFILHVICIIEAVLVAPFLFIAPDGTRVPIFHTKPTVVADIVVCKILHNVEKFNMLLQLCRLNPGQDVRNHIASRERHGGH